MKRITYLVVLFCLNFTLFSQTMPEVTVGEDHLKLSKLDISSVIVGNIATTTYDMSFFNPQNRILEGELAFPLGQGQHVTHFAMDVNGKLRDAVIVEKELGRVAFENTTRLTIDPGLLEKTKGNNYRARIYPIPSNGYKRIVVTFEQVLSTSEGFNVMVIPLNSKQKLDAFSMSFEHVSSVIPEIESNIYKGLEFKLKDGKMKANFRKKQFAPREAITLKFPIKDSQTVTRYKDYFHIYKTFDVVSKPKKKPENITLFWDVSYSMKFRNLKKELQLLDQYFKHLNSVNVRLIMFSNTIKKDMNFSVENGKWTAVKKVIKSAVYDGGTSYLLLNDFMSSENIFFSDGMDNLGELNLNSFDLETPSITTVNAVSSSDHEKLESIANHSGSQYINLNLHSVQNAQDLLINETFRFLGYKSNDDVHEVFPKKYASVQGGISISGRFSKKTSIELLFGYNYSDFEVFEVNLETLTNEQIVKRLWATQKLNHLSKNKKENKAAIIDLAKCYHLISDYTSMIVLDRIEDYVRYKIEPPKDLMAEYKERILMTKENELDRLEELEDRKKDLIEEYDDVKKWYHTDFSKLKTVKKVKKKATQTVSAQDQQDNTNIEQTVKEISTQDTESIQNDDSAVINQPTNSEGDGEYSFISGVVTSAIDSLPLPGANVIIKGTSRGTQTDFDGNFTIGVRTDDILVIAYIGFITTEVSVGENQYIDISLDSDESQLDEVVVVAYSARKRSSSMMSSVARVTTESIAHSNLNQILNGKAAGLSIEGDNGKPEVGSDVLIRSIGSMNNNKEPLYIIDGKPVDRAIFKSLGSDQISSINILKDAGANAIFGDRGANGVIVVTTNEGHQTKGKDIEDLNNKIQNEFELKPWKPNSEYVRILSNMGSTKEAYKTYLDLRNTYHNVPTFFMDVADFFESKNESEIAIQILSNLIEINIDNHELMRALAYNFEEAKNYQAAAYVYEAILEMRPEHPQSYRDLALVYEETGRYQEAFDLLYKIVDGELLEKDEDERYFGIEQIAYVEARRIVSLHKKRITISDKQLKLLNKFEVDIRIVIDWNHDNTDIDLWIVNPENEKIYYSNNTSHHGGRLSEDLTEGYGPEEFLLKKAKQGHYKVLVDYYGDDVQKISGPTTLKVTMFTNYGTKKETKTVRVMRLSEKDEEYEVGVVKF